MLPKSGALCRSKSINLHTFAVMTGWAWEKATSSGVAHTADEIVDDLHQLLKAARLLPPYVMVGHSIGGIYVRKYAALYPAEVLDWYW